MHQPHSLVYVPTIKEDKIHKRLAPAKGLTEQSESTNVKTGTYKPARLLNCMWTRAHVRRVLQDELCVRAVNICSLLQDIIEEFPRVKQQQSMSLKPRLLFHCLSPFPFLP